MGKVGWVAVGSGDLALGCGAVPGIWGASWMLACGRCGAKTDQRNHTDWSCAQDMVQIMLFCVQVQLRGVNGQAPHGCTQVKIEH